MSKQRRQPGSIRKGLLEGNYPDELHGRLYFMLPRSTQ